MSILHLSYGRIGFYLFSASLYVFKWKSIALSYRFKIMMHVICGGWSRQGVKLAHIASSEKKKLFSSIYKRKHIKYKNHSRYIHCCFVRPEANHIRFYWDLYWPNPGWYVFNAWAVASARVTKSGFLIKNKWKKGHTKAKTMIDFSRVESVSICRFSSALFFIYSHAHTLKDDWHANKSITFRCLFLFHFTYVFFFGKLVSVYFSCIAFISSTLCK